MPIAEFPARATGATTASALCAGTQLRHARRICKALIDAAHGHGLMVFLDVVYNHFGPDGNYLPLLRTEMFRDDISTPWGPAIDFRRPKSAGSLRKMRSTGCWIPVRRSSL